MTVTRRSLPPLWRGKTWGEEVDVANTKTPSLEKQKRGVRISKSPGNTPNQEFASEEAGSSPQLIQFILTLLYSAKTRRLLHLRFYVFGDPDP